MAYGRTGHGIHPPLILSAGPSVSSYSFDREGRAIDIVAPERGWLSTIEPPLVCIRAAGGYEREEPVDESDDEVDIADNDLVVCGWMTV